MWCRSLCGAFFRLPGILGTLRRQSDFILSTASRQRRYDSGSVEGRVIRDEVTIDGMTVHAVEMGLVRQQRQQIRGLKADGIVGLAFPSISSTRNTSPSRYSTFLQLLGEQHDNVGDLFSVFLTRKSMLVFSRCILFFVARVYSAGERVVVCIRYMGGAKFQTYPALSVHDVFDNPPSRTHIPKFQLDSARQ